MYQHARAMVQRRHANDPIWHMCLYCKEQWPCAKFERWNNIYQHPERYLSWNVLEIAPYAP